MDGSRVRHGGGLAELAVRLLCGDCILWPLAYASGCGPGRTPEECSAVIEEGDLELAPIKKTLRAHIAWMDAHPAARCYRDAYAADRAVVERYLSWIASWRPAEGDNTGEGRAQIYELQDVDAAASNFFAQLNAFLADCG